MRLSINKSNIRYNKHIRLLMVLFMVGFIVLLFPRGESIESEITVGSVWIHDDLIASSAFEILKEPDVYKVEKAIAAEKIYPIFLRDTSIANIMLDSLQKYDSYLSGILNRKNVGEIRNTFLSKESLQSIASLSKQSAKYSLNSVLKYLQSLSNELYQKGILNVSANEIKKDSITIRNGKFERLLPKNTFINTSSLNEYLEFKLKSFFGNKESLVEASEEYLFHFIKPNIIYSHGLTDDAIKNAVNQVPRNIGIVNENERIIAKHDRITPEKKLKIDSYKISKGEERSLWSYFLQSIGKFIHIILILLPFVIYVSLFRKKIFTDNLMIVLIGCVIIFIAILTFLVNSLSISVPLEFLVIIPATSMLLTIIFDSRVGFYGTIVVSLVAGALRGNDYVFALTNIVAGGIAAYTVRDIKNRAVIFRSFLYILLGYSLSIIAFGLERFEDVSNMISSLAFAASNALLSPLLAYGLIIFVERIFKITTDLTLLELADLNRPLLKELAKQAPGTFSHSVAMGTLAETTAEAISANPVLAKVGAYYHDIGKTFHPEGFVENQIDTHNIHENLSPEESTELIREHIQKGIELSKRSKLPQEVLDFIPMHHGTMVISFFYEKAKNLYGESNINIDEFRYHGPKPNSKETAIVMLADSCESAIRSLSDADSQTIENVINNLINNRIEDGQLDEAPLTFSDIKKIKESFLSILVGHQHRRIRYPKQDELETKNED